MTNDLHSCDCIHHKKSPQEPAALWDWRASKEKRRKQLEEVRRRRKVMYELMRKMQSQSRY